MSQQRQVIAFAGGLDLVSPPSQVPPGSVIGAVNYECEARGYARVDGYERFDGQSAPSGATYLYLSYDAGVGAFAAGDTVTGASSGATGTALTSVSTETGALVLYDVTGTFIDNEALQVASVTKATANGTGSTDGAPDALHSGYIESITTLRRAAIGRPTGEGAIRGGFVYGGTVYCFRDNVGSTQGQMFKATATGWELQTFGSTIDFIEGVDEFVEGETITGGTSGAQATVKRVVTQSGQWDIGAVDQGDAAGYLVLADIVGTFIAGETLVGPTGEATSSTAAVEITLPAGGTYECIIANFYAVEGYERVYFVTRTGTAFEYDGSVLAPIITGNDNDVPEHIAFHRGHLFLSFPGGSLQNSSTGLPLVWNAITGASEIGFGQEITGLKPETRDALIVAGRNKIGYLTGASLNDFDLASITESSGAIENTLEVVGFPIFLDDMGLRDLQAAQSFGDWKTGTLSTRVEPLFRSKRVGNLFPVGVFRVKAKDQYRMFWADGTGISLYLGRKKPEIMPIEVLFTPACFWTGEDANGVEMIFAGDDTGWVYQMDKGTSQDGSEIEAFVRLGFVNQGDALQHKRYHRVVLEGQAGTRNSVVSLGADFDYGNDSMPAMSDVDATLEATMYGSGGFWGSTTWDEFFWSSEVSGELWYDLYAVASNVSIVIGSVSATETPHVLSTITLTFTPRKKRRG